MMKTKLILILTLALVQSLSIAQITVPDASPASTLTQKVGFSELTIEYNRPQLKGRDMFKDLTREGEVWRTGANMSTRLTLTDEVTLAGKVIPAGKYSIYSIPGKKEWTVIINKKISWGTQYDANEDLFRIARPTQTTENSVENFTFYFTNVTEESAILGFAWGTSKVEMDLKVDIHSKILAQIDEVMSDEASATNPDFYNAADYYMKKGLDADKALKWATIFADEKMSDQYWAHGLKARAQANAGKYKEAAKTAQKVVEMAEVAGNQDYVYNYGKYMTEWSTKK